MQQSHDHITKHGGWIMYYIGATESKNFRPQYPWLEHRAVVFATIYIQHSFVNDLKERALSGLKTCMRFLERMGSIWPVVANMIGATPAVISAYSTLNPANSFEGK